jgi:uncharacterized RDD family membrane protein YckC
MNRIRSQRLASLLAISLSIWPLIAHAEPTAATPETADADSDWQERFEGHRRHSDNLVNIGDDSDLPRGEHADSVVSILGSSSIEGETREVVSILGNTRVNGPVKQGAVAVLGNTYVDDTVGGDVVAVLGNVELGPHANVGGNVVAVGGTVKRDPNSIVAGGMQSIAAGAASFGWLRPWIDHCLFYGRPLSLARGLGWAWSLAFAFLALYACLALLFREGIVRCAQTFETQPGRTALAALLTVLLVPVLLVLLCISIIGIAAVPFVVIGLFCAGLFGKAVMVAWLGRRCLGPRSGALAHPVWAVLIGGVIVLGLYLIPVLGFILYKLLGLLGLGAVVYTLTHSARAWQAARSDGLAASPAATPPPDAVPPPNAVPPPDAVPPVGPSFQAAAASVSTGAASVAAVSDTIGPVPAAAAPGPAPGPAPGATPSATPGPAPGATPGVGAGAAPAISAVLPRAGFWVRMLALLLDGLLIGFLMGFLHHAFHFELVVLAIYGAMMWKLRGSTIGGMVFDLQVVRLDGRPIDWETAIVRALGCFLSMAVAGLGFFWIAFDDAKQAWHDKIAGTVVVRVAKGVPLV